MKVRIIVKDYGNIDIILDEKNAPITVKNFIDLVNDGFYKGICFHRVIDGFVIQAGDKTKTGIYGSDKKIKGEFIKNGVNNLHKHTKGTISMARTNDYNSASSQFFICLNDLPSLDGLYAAFGDVYSGMDVVNKIGSVKTDYNDLPTDDVVISDILVLKNE